MHVLPAAISARSDAAQWAYQQEHCHKYTAQRASSDLNLGQPRQQAHCGCHRHTNLGRQCAPHSDQARPASAGCNLRLHLPFPDIVVVVAAASDCHESIRGTLTRGDEVKGKRNC